MGESTPQVNPLGDPRAGSISLANWLNLSSISPAVANQLNLLVPTQEVRSFQRQVIARELPAAIAQGQQPIFQAVVPDDEAWQLHWMTYFHDDNIGHTIRLSITPRLQNPDSLMHFGRLLAPSDIDTPIYPATATPALSNSNFFMKTGPRPEFFPGDLLLFVDETIRANAVAGTARLMFRYELIPLPVQIRADTVWTLNVIP